jgi:3-oxoacyl-[acyl-carrier protein] reductase
MDLEAKIAIVTGAGRGIGREIALKLASEGAAVVIVDIDEKNVEGVYKEMTEQGKRALPFIGDVSDEKDVKKLIEKARNEYGKIDILVNNAGISPKKGGRKQNVIEISLDEWNQVLKVNLTSVFLCCKGVLPHFMEQRDGRIVNISSSAVFDGGFLAASHYVASKGGISALTRTLAREGASYGIRVNAVAPGRIQTPMALLTSDERNRETLSRIPLGRFGLPTDVADAVLYLVSDGSNYITGITLNLSGGYVIN